MRCFGNLKKSLKQITYKERNEMSYVAKITNNGELTIGNGQCVITKETLEAALSEFNAKLAHQNVLGHLHRRNCGELEHMGFSQKVVSAFCNGGEGFAVIEPINTPDGRELNRIMKDCGKMAESDNGYVFAPNGYMDQDVFNLTSIDVVKK